VPQKGRGRSARGSREQVRWETGVPNLFTVMRRRSVASVLVLAVAIRLLLLVLVVHVHVHVDDMDMD